MHASATEPQAPPAMARAIPNGRCFACGPHHPHGLRLRFTQMGEHGVTAPWRTGPQWEGFQGVIHGGIVVTVLDEAMSKAVAASGAPALTCELRVRLRRHIAPAEHLRVNGWIVEKRKRRIATEASLTDEDGQERAHAWAAFLELPAGRSHFQNRSIKEKS